MNGEGFTGLDPDSALMAIDVFEAEGKKVYQEMFDANKNFLNELSTNCWWSEKAEGFGRRAIPMLYEAQELIRLEFNNTIDADVDAYNKLAEANGYPGVPDSHEHEDFVDLSGTASNCFFTEGEGFKNISPNGEVGMKVQRAIACLDVFVNQVEGVVIPDLEAIPYYIAFFDPGDAMKTAYKNRVKALVEKIRATVKDVSEDISAQMQDEQLEIEKGANQATEAMNGSSTNA